MKTIAYLTNLYARASDSFIRAEVAQLRSLGHTVYTFSVREPDASERVSRDIREEHDRTDYILRHGIGPLLFCAVAECLRAPCRFASAWLLAMRCGWPGIKGRLWPWAYFLEACYLSRQLREKQVDHLHDHIGEGCATVAMLASALSGVSFSLTIHGPGEFDRAEILALDEKLRRARFVIAVSEFGRSQLCRWSDVSDWSRIRVLRCGVLTENARNTPVPDNRRLVCVGRLSPEKGHLILVEAVALLRTEPAFEVIIVGDGPLRREIEEKSAELGVRDRITLAGWLGADAVQDAIASSRAMVLPSFAEGLPVVLMEAFLQHRPVIASAIAGIPELVEHGVSGWLVPAGSVGELATAMRDLLATPPERLTHMGRAGAARVQKEHDQRTQARKLETLLVASSVD